LSFRFPLQIFGFFLQITKSDSQTSYNHCHVTLCNYSRYEPSHSHRPIIWLQRIFYRLAYNRIVIFLENRPSLITTFHTLCKSRSVSKWVSGSGGHAAVCFCLRVCRICFTVSSLLLFQSRIRLIAKMQSCRLFGAKLKPLAGFATKNQLACMSAVPEPIRKPDVKFSKVNL